MDEITGRAKATLEGVRMIRPTEARSYLTASRWMAAGAFHNFSGPIDCAIAGASQIAQSLECVLKAYLSFSGLSKGKLMDPSLRHNLEALWTLAADNGLKVDPLPSGWCKLLNTAHNNPFFFRYPMGLNGMVTPPPLEMEQGLRDILQLVEAQIR
ncbi:hypothetical protein [Caballeronia grimmiae]|uniref:hypothetical protein n=1 Tax=Caballeronia grimmiae TaxID=1071679 RepID=UPI0038B73843